MFDSYFGKYVDIFSKLFYKVICKKTLCVHTAKISTIPAIFYTAM